MTSPARISARCSDSSNRAAKDSDIEIAVGTAGLKLMIPATGALLRGGSVGGLLLLRWGSAFGAHHHLAKQPLYLGSKACFSPHHCRTCATDCSTVWPELSSNRASSAGLRGATAGLESRASRASRSARRAPSVAEMPFEINCLCLGSARWAALAVRYTLRAASGKITVPMSRPSA